MTDEVVAALRARGIDSPEQLLQYGTADQILAACQRWDARENVRPGLLVRWIRDQDFPDPEPPQSRAAQLRARFDEFVRRHPDGASVEWHADLIRRRWPQDLEHEEPCPGEMLVEDAIYPVVTMRCDVCGFEAGVGPRDLHLLGANG